MSIQFQAPALSPSQRYLTAALLRLRRLINRSVANMLANRERAATQFMLKECGDRELGEGGPRSSRTGVRAVLFGLIVAGSLSPAAAKAEEPVVRDHRGGRAPQVTGPRCDTGIHTSDEGCVTASGIASVRDHCLR